MSDHCPIPEHHHKKAAAAPAHQHMAMDHMAMDHAASDPVSSGHMDCGHDMAMMTECAMSCCQQDQVAVTVALIFVLPSPVSLSARLAITSGAELRQAIASPRSLEPLSPPPRFAVAAS
jgi:hypothetical protein